jgi:hypothetical protein
MNICGIDCQKKKDEGRKSAERNTAYET